MCSSLISPSRFGNSARDQAGFSLIEVAISVAIFAVLMIGVLGAMIQSRKMTESAIYQNSAVTITQGYIEQMKNMDFNELPYYQGNALMRDGETTIDPVIYTQLDVDTYDTLSISPGPVPSRNFIKKGKRPTGVVDNNKLIDINNTPNDPTDDLGLNIWVWIMALDDPSTRVGDSRQITIVYNWSFDAGSVNMDFRDTVTTVRSRVPTF